jgi:two-component system OmpR family response regulator/two-component system phosphate regulon response regulator OmpR
MAELKTRILVVDDDQRLRDLLVKYLGGEGYEVKAVPDGAGMDKQLARERYDVVVLDLMLPGEDGLSICRRLRAQGQNQPGSPAIIMLTAKGDDVDRIVGLEMGADDYLAKPFNPRELLARIRAVLRRTAQASAGRPRFRTGHLEIDFDAREVVVDGKRVVLTHHEFELLAVLARAAGRVLSREQVLDALKGQEYETFDRSIDVHVSKLRAKIERDPKAPRYIKTVRGVGYALMRDAG